jgi:hypothetical protein
MTEAEPGNEGHQLFLTERPAWLPGSHVLALILGTAVIAGVVIFQIHRDYQSSRAERIRLPAISFRC